MHLIWDLMVYFAREAMICDFSPNGSVEYNKMILTRDSGIYLIV